MTITEMYEWAKERGIEDYEAVVQYRDDGGDYWGEDEDIRCWINKGVRKVVL